MKIYNILLLLFYVLFSYSCVNSEKSKTESESNFIKIKGEKQKLQNSILATEIVIYDDYFFTSNISYPKVSVYNSHLAKTESFINRGRSKYEVSGGREISVSKLNKELVFTDGVGKKIVICDLDL